MGPPLARYRRVWKTNSSLLLEQTETGSRVLDLGTSFCTTDGSIRKIIKTRTMDELFVIWMEDHVRLTKATTTYHSYQSILNRIPKWFMQLKVDRVEPTHAQRLLANWHREGLKALTINSRRAIFVGMFSWAIRMNNYKGTNPFSAVAKLNEGLKEMET
ncbi:hypothetical protein EXIGUO9Y_90009 [Exiguobacterium oxidotolerans]|uniref:Core-binding (CB) domain-containing protein n=1 Tax=Exiguobacterium oxidotolerans TaxID=223958 RepID=A0A653IIM4_9BACL|nr:hypothetical protein EXIGUO9Y_90009 [Exiguobacterium oxidotolerans]